MAYSINQGKLKDWGKLIFLTGSAQVVVQATSLLCGIAIIHLLPTKEYALYTLANTLLGSMTVLADGGINSSVMAEGGKVWQDKDKLGSVISTGFYLRKRMAIVSLTISIPILLYFLVHQNASWWQAVLIVLAIIPSFTAALSDAILEAAPKLHQSIRPLQVNQMQVSIGRFVLSCISLFIFPFTGIAVLANGIPRIYGNVKLRQISNRFATTNRPIDQVVKKNIISNIKRMLPEIGYYCISGQLNIWIISLFGSTMALASLGAIGRLSMVLSLISTLFNTLVVPRFARLPVNKEKMLKYFFLILIGMSGISLFFITTTYLASNQLLWILGKNYKGLNQELVLSVVGSCISLLAGASFSILICRGWAINPVFYISISIIATIVSIMIVNVSTLSGVLLFNIIINVVQCITLAIYCFYKIKSVRPQF